MTELFKKDCKFILSAPKMEFLPPDRHPEIAFIGRSNVGKSSLLNALTSKKLAKASNTPGRTQAINFFLLAEKYMLVDLPGYGYAKAPKSMVNAWNRLVKAYLKHRPNLKRALVLVDARRGLMDSDHAMMALLDDHAVSYQVVLTKADKLSTNALEKVKEATLKDLEKHPAAYPDLVITSAENRTGLDELRGTITALLKTK